MTREEQLEQCIRDLRDALELCTDPAGGWPEVEVAHAYEASRVLVPDTGECGHHVPLDWNCNACSDQAASGGRPNPRERQEPA